MGGITTFGEVDALTPEQALAIPGMTTRTHNRARRLIEIFRHMEKVRIEREQNEVLAAMPDAEFFAYLAQKKRPN